MEARNDIETSAKVNLRKLFQRYLDDCANVTGTNKALVSRITSYQISLSSFSARSAPWASDTAPLGFTSTAAKETTSML